MPRLCFKTRRDGQTVQLVHHLYCPARQRSRTVTLGSLRRDSDPDFPETGLRLVQGVTLDAAQYQQIQQWLRKHGDTDAATRRRVLLERIEAQVRAALQQCQPFSEGRNPFELAVQALQSLSGALPQLSQAVTATGGDPWAVLRPDYIEVYHAWEMLLEAAKTAGIAKQKKRGGLAHQDAPSASGNPESCEALVDAAVTEVNHDAL